jgi:hypothetical protein
LIGSGLRAGLAIFLVLVPLVLTEGAGAQVQAAQTCPEPVFVQTFPYATAGQLVPAQLTSVTPGSDYLLKVSGLEQRSGTAKTDEVSRKFRMPDLGGKRHQARLVMVVANDACENSPWKLEQAMGYRPPVVQTPAQTQTQTQAQTQTQTHTPATTPSPVSTPKPVKPVVPKALLVPREPPKDARAWLTPLDQFSRTEEKAPQPSLSAIPRLERKTDKANSNVALLGLGGVFILIGGISAIAWTRFRRYDDAELARLLNSDGKIEKLPSMLDDSAIDLHVTSGGTVASDAAAHHDRTPAGQKPGDPNQAPVKAKQVSVKGLVVPPAQKPAAGPAPAIVPPVANGAPPQVNGNGSHAEAHMYRKEVEAELQHVLSEAGLDTELQGILSDARAEAERQGVSMDADLIMRALCGEVNGSARLSESAKGELKHRFQRIADEERGIRPVSE